MDNEKDIQAAKTRLEDAVSAVATAAQCLQQIEGVRIKEGALVDLEDWKELQEALAEWRAATQHFLATALEAGRGPEIGDIIAVRRRAGLVAAHGGQKFYVSCGGDPSVGIPGQQAEVLLWVDPHDSEAIPFVKEQLASAFTAIWDERVMVLTEEEFKADIA
jgi:hypothetical protein